MSRNTKIALGIGGALVILCLGVCALGVILLPRFTQNAIARDATSAKRIAANIADYTLPPGYAEAAGMDFLIYQMVIIAPSGGSGQGMSFILMGTRAGAANQEEMQRQMQQSFQQQFGRAGSSMQVVGQKHVTIRGQDVVMTIAENDASHLRQAIGAFNGKNGTVMVMVMGDSPGWNDEVMQSFLESIQ